MMQVHVLDVYWTIVVSIYRTMVVRWYVNRPWKSWFAHDDRYCPMMDSRLQWGQKYEV